MLLVCPTPTWHNSHPGRSSTIAPAITDIIASATNKCPDTYEAVRMNGVGNSNLYAASPVDTGMYLCIQRMLPESAAGQFNTLEKTRGIKPDNDHRVERAIEHFVERSEAQVRSLARPPEQCPCRLAPSPPQMLSPHPRVTLPSRKDANGDKHLHRQATKAGGLARVGGALAGALEASRPHRHVLNAVRESVATPGSTVHPTKDAVNTEKDVDGEQVGLEALEELESALLGDVSLLQITEERADSALSDPNVNAVLGMGAIGSEPKTKVTVKSQSALCPDDQCPRQKVVNLGYIAKGCARPASAAQLHTARVAANAHHAGLKSTTPFRVTATTSFTATRILRARVSILASRVTVVPTFSS